MGLVVLVGKETGMEMEEFSTGAIREKKTGKGRCDLLPMCALLRLSKHYEKGSDDHGERNWEKGIPMHSFLDSAIRHLFKYMDGWTDEDHLCAAAWNILGAMWTEEKRPDLQDIPARNTSPSHGKGSSLAQNAVGGQKPVSSSLGQRKATEKLRDICRYYYNDEAVGSFCTGTRDIDECSCGGDKSECDFAKGSVRIKARFVSEE